MTDIITYPTPVAGSDLYDSEFPPLVYDVEGVIVHGTLFMLAGRPKSGKSWLLLQLARAIDTGSAWLGAQTHCFGRVLYIALEDGKRRVWERIRSMSWRPQQVDFLFDLPPLADGGREAIVYYTSLYSVVILDTLRAALGATEENSNTEIASVLVPLVRDVHERESTLIISHHTSKLAGEDRTFEAIRGASAIRGSYDGGAVLSRPHGEKRATLYLESRDLEVQDIAIEWRGPHEGWALVGKQDEMHLREVIEAIRALDGEATAAQVASVLGITEEGARQKLRAAVRAGMLRVAKKDDGKRGRPQIVFRL
ncbi:MAG: AAA family ATPase [Thermoflexales bacterium]|nr:AAA family ATPase [Thermoflexales bacterium]